MQEREQAQNQLSALLSRKSASRKWTLRMEGYAVAADTGTDLVQCMQRIQGHAPVLTAHTIIMDFEYDDSAAVVRSIAALLGGIRFPRLCELEIRTHEQHQSNTADPQWLYVGRALADMPAEQRSSINTLRISGFTLPNPTLSSMLSHLPNIRTLRLPWAWVRTSNYVSVGQLTVMWQQLTHVEDFANIPTASPSMLRAMRMPSVTHVTLAHGEEARLEQLTALFPGVQLISGGYVSVRAMQLPTHIPDCTALRVSVDDAWPPGTQLQMQLQAGALPSTHTGVVRISVSDCMERVRNLLMQLLVSAPNMRSVRMIFERGDASTMLQTVAPILHALVSSRRLGSIFVQLHLHMRERKQCKQQLDAALQQSFTLADKNRLLLAVGDCLIKIVLSPLFVDQ